MSNAKKSLAKEFEEDNLRNLKKHKDFRIAAEYVADLIKEVPEVVKIVLFGSVGLPLQKEYSRLRKYKRYKKEDWMKKKIIYLTAIFIIIFSAVLTAEKNIDREIAELEKKLANVTGKEKIAILNELAEKHYFQNPKEVLKYANLALELSQTINDRKGEAESLRNIGIGNWLLGDANKALEYGQKALKIFEEIKDKKGIAKALGNIGQVYSRLGNHKKALEYFRRTLKIFEKTGNK